MLRGTSIFICDNCGHIFKALDIEYNCTALSAPQKCPKCGSYHTMPMNDLDFPGKTIYEGIWEHKIRLVIIMSLATIQVTYLRRV